MKLNWILILFLLPMQLFATDRAVLFDSATGNFLNISFGSYTNANDLGNAAASGGGAGASAGVVQSGRATVTGSVNTIAFPFTFATAPKVVGSPWSNATETVHIETFNETTTNFDFQVLATGGVVTSGIDINWIASETNAGTFTNAQSISCTMGLTANQTINNNIETTVQYDEIYDNPYSLADTNNYRIYLRRIGRWCAYHTTGVADLDQGKWGRALVYHVSGGTTNYSGYARHDAATDNHLISLAASCIVVATTTNDYVYVSVKHGNGDNTPYIHATDRISEFGVFYLGE